MNIVDSVGRLFGGDGDKTSFEDISPLKSACRK
jgi:hypothetical protein